MRVRVPLAAPWRSSRIGTCTRLRTERLKGIEGSTPSCATISGPVAEWHMHPPQERTGSRFESEQAHHLSSLEPHESAGSRHRVVSADVEGFDSPVRRQRPETV